MDTLGWDGMPKTHNQEVAEQIHIKVINARGCTAWFAIQSILISLTSQAISKWKLLELEVKLNKEI